METVQQEAQTIHFVFKRDADGNEIRPEGMTAPGHVYMHGELESESGWDIPFSATNFKNIETGLYPATFNGEDGYTLYFWQKQLDVKVFQPRGLLVRDTDTLSAEYAKNRFNEQSTFL